MDNGPRSSGAGEGVDVTVLAPGLVHVARFLSAAEAERMARTVVEWGRRFALSVPSASLCHVG
jgi:hypothetical protein